MSNLQELFIKEGNLLGLTKIDSIGNKVVPAMSPFQKCSLEGMWKSTGNKAVGAMLAAPYGSPCGQHTYCIGAGYRVSGGSGALTVLLYSSESLTFILLRFQGLRFARSV